LLQRYQASESTQKLSGVNEFDDIEEKLQGYRLSMVDMKGISVTVLLCIFQTQE
jgi:hypothetical protein